MKTRLVIAGAGALLLVGLGIGASAYAGAPVVPFLAAAKPSPSPGEKSQACSNFLSHLAANLGVSQSKLHSALQKSADQTIDDAVAAGKLSASQAAKLKTRIDKGAVCSFRPALGPFQHGRRVQLAMVMLKAAAEVLKITPQQLVQDVRTGHTVSSLAHGMTEAQFRQAWLAQLKADLDALVTKKEVSQAQEQKFLQELQNAPIPFWNSAKESPLRPSWSGYPQQPPPTPAASS